MLNTIWCVSPINETTGGTEFLLGSQHSEAPPSGEEFDKKHMVIDANPGDVVMFDPEFGIGQEVQNKALRSVSFSHLFIRDRLSSPGLIM